MQKHKEPNIPAQTLGTSSEPIIVPDVDVPSSIPHHGDDAQPAQSTEAFRPQRQAVKTNPAHARLGTASDPGDAFTGDEDCSQAKTTKDHDLAYLQKQRIKRQRLIYKSLVSSDAAASHLGLVSAYDNHTKPELEL